MLDEDETGLVERLLRRTSGRAAAMGDRSSSSSNDEADGMSAAAAASGVGVDSMSDEEAPLLADPRGSSMSGGGGSGERSGRSVSAKLIFPSRFVL